MDIEKSLDDPTASPHWEWRPGMLMDSSVPAQLPWSPGQLRATVTGARVIDVDSKGRPWANYTRDDGFGGGYGALDGPDARPDLDDPATCGCLLALVRKAWDAARIEVVVFDDGRAGVRIIRDDASTVEFVDLSLGFALASTLLAAPPKGERP